MATWLDRNTVSVSPQRHHDPCFRSFDCSNSPSPGCALNSFRRQQSADDHHDEHSYPYPVAGPAPSSSRRQRRRSTRPELSLFTKTAVGNNFLTLTSNSSNYPMASDHHFSLGSSYTNSTSDGDDNYISQRYRTPPAVQTHSRSDRRHHQCLGVAADSTVSSPWVEIQCHHRRRWRSRWRLSVRFPSEKISLVSRSHPGLTEKC